MNIWDLFKKYDCINIKIDSIEEMKEMLKLAKENNFEIPYEDYHEGIYVYFEGNFLECTYANLIDILSFSLVSKISCIFFLSI